MNLADDRVFRPISGISSADRDDRRFRLIYHGTLARRYGIDLALRALDLVRREIPEVHLTVHGLGEYLEPLLHLAGELGLNGHVTFSTQRVPTAELSRLITSADVGIVPYRRDVFTDGILPTKLMEYAALGIPAIVGRTPTISGYFDETMVEFFTAGDVEDLARCIRTLYQNRSRLEELGRNIQGFNQHYNWSSHKIEYVNLVKRLAENKL
jgi:glycosyltransferase involved in cell wall biosynthesis